MLPKIRTSPTSISYGIDNIFIYVCIIYFVTKTHIIPIIPYCVNCFSSRALEQLGLPHPFPLLTVVIHLNSSYHSMGTWSTFNHLRTFCQIIPNSVQRKKKWLILSSLWQKQHFRTTTTPNFWSLSFVANLQWHAIQNINRALGRAIFWYIVCLSIDHRVIHFQHLIYYSCDYLTDAVGSSERKSKC
jgi:hypothetical protein